MSKSFNSYFFSCSNYFRSFARMQMKIFKIGFCTNNNTQILIVLKLFQIIFSIKKNGLKENKRERMVQWKRKLINLRWGLITVLRDSPPIVWVCCLFANLFKTVSLKHESNPENINVSLRDQSLTVFNFSCGWLSQWFSLNFFLQVQLPFKSSSKNLAVQVFDF